MCLIALLMLLSSSRFFCRFYWIFYRDDVSSVNKVNFTSSFPILIYFIPSLFLVWKFCKGSKLGQLWDSVCFFPIFQWPLSFFALCSVPCKPLFHISISISISSIISVSVSISHYLSICFFCLFVFYCLVVYSTRVNPVPVTPSWPETVVFFTWIYDKDKRWDFKNNLQVCCQGHGHGPERFWAHYT